MSHEPCPCRGGRSLWADAWARLKANKAALVERLFSRLHGFICIFGPWFTPHAFTTIYQDYNRVPPSLSAYPKPEMIDLAVRTRCAAAASQLAGWEEKGRTNFHHGDLRQTHRRAHDPLHRPLQRIRRTPGREKYPLTA